MEKRNALIVFGGNSFEHDISIITTLIVYNTASNSKYNFLPVYIDKNNEWFFYTKDNLNIKLFKNFENTYEKSGFKKVYFKTGQSCLFYKKGLFEKRIEISVALNCCHGGIGENGTLVAFLNSHKIPVSSGSMLGMSICMDKIATKYYLKGASLPVIDFFKFTKNEYENNKEIVIKKLNDLGFPVILKPASLGSSIGIKVAKNLEEFQDSVKVALEFDDNILVEKAILELMEEYNVACLKTEKGIIVSNIDKPIKSDEILSFKDKYIGEGKSSKIPSKTGGSKARGSFIDNKINSVKLNHKIEDKLKNMSKKIYQILDLSGVVRIDFIVEKNKRIYVNEINTVPGSLGYYFFIPSHFENMSEYIDSMLNIAKLDFEQKKNVKNEFITKLI